MPDAISRCAVFAERFALLRQQYANDCINTLEELAGCVLGVGEDVPRAALENLRARLHQLAGSGGSFGYPELSKEARALETMAIDWLKSDAAPPQAQWEEWKSSLLALRQTLLSSPTPLADMLE